MAVYTRHGGRTVKVVGGDIKRGIIDIQFKNNVKRRVWLSSLVADGGINEIKNCIENLKKGGK